MNIHAGAVQSVVAGGALIDDIHQADTQHDLTSHIAVADEILDDGLDAVDRNGKADVIHGIAAGIAGGFGIDNADQLSAGIKETAAGITGVDRRAGLQQGHVVAVYRYLALQRADDTIGDGAGKGTQRVADGQHGVAHLQGVTVAQNSRGQVFGVHLQHRDVIILIGTHQGGGIGAAVIGSHGDLLCAFYHMVVGHNVAIRRQHHAGACALGDILPEEVVGRHTFGGDGHYAVLHLLHHTGITDADGGTVGGRDLYPLIQNGGTGAQQAALGSDHSAACAAHHREHQAACQQQRRPFLAPSCGFFVCVRGMIPRSSRLLRLPGRGILMDAVFIIAILPGGKIGIAGGKVAVIKVVVRICHGTDLPFCGVPSPLTAS